MIVNSGHYLEKFGKILKWKNEHSIISGISEQQVIVSESKVMCDNHDTG